MNRCNDSEFFRQKYPETVVALFMSTTETATDVTDTQRNAHIADSFDGYLNELEKLGQASASPGGTSKVADPYTSELRPITELKRIYTAQNVMLDTVEFFGYDVTLDGSTEQDAATLAAIYGSRTANNDIIPQSYYKNTLLSLNWQPNGFRPAVLIDGRPIIKGIDASAFGGGVNKGDLSIGLPLPYCLDYNRELGQVQDIRVHAQLSQKVGGLYQRYPILCKMTFWIGQGVSI